MCVCARDGCLRAQRDGGGQRVEDVENADPALWIRTRHGPRRGDVEAVEEEQAEGLDLRHCPVATGTHAHAESKRRPGAHRLATDLERSRTAVCLEARLVKRLKSTIVLDALALLLGPPLRVVLAVVNVPEEELEHVALLELHGHDGVVGAEGANDSVLQAEPRHVLRTVHAQHFVDNVIQQGQVVALEQVRVGSDLVDGLGRASRFPERVELCAEAVDHVGLLEKEADDPGARKRRLGGSEPGGAHADGDGIAVREAMLLLEVGHEFAHLERALGQMLVDLLEHDVEEAVPRFERFGRRAAAGEGVELGVPDAERGVLTLGERLCEERLDGGLEEAHAELLEEVGGCAGLDALELPLDGVDETLLERGEARAGEEVRRVLDVDSATLAREPVAGRFRDAPHGSGKDVERADVEAFGLFDDILEGECVADVDARATRRLHHAEDVTVAFTAGQPVVAHVALVRHARVWRFIDERRALQRWRVGDAARFLLEEQQHDCDCSHGCDPDGDAVDPQVNHDGRLADRDGGVGKERM
ncbi:hypothetical protein L1887_48253 [Cichorium endivia]|nr:hypothetical protein L1887_48253 [Cichorium endivia]